MRNRAVSALLKTGQSFAYLVGRILVRVRYSDRAIDLCCHVREPLARVSKEYASCVSANVRANGRFSAGKKICFMTSAEKVRLIVLYRRRCLLKNMSYIACSGVDVYQKCNENEKWCRCVAPDSPFQMLVSEWLTFDKGMKNIVLYLPPYAQINKLMLEGAEDFKYTGEQGEKKLISVYGSSVSQGCSASRPGLSYASLLSRYFDADINNCAFSEGARGERFVIEKILLRKKSDVVIVEYDHNSPLEEFAHRHLCVYQYIREHTDVPIIFLSRISGGLSDSDDENSKRIRNIQNTLRYAEEKKDKKVWFINGDEIAGERKSLYLVDDRHPNDLGMKLIADAVSCVLREKVFNGNDEGNP